MDTQTPETCVNGEAHTPEPLAIVGTGLRLPGEIHTTEELWSLLAEKRSTRCKVPGDRFNVDAFHSECGRLGAMRTKFGHFLTDPNCLEHLDTHMFPMMKKELQVLDPQERLLLEVVYECMQNAGQTAWRGEDVGCFAGVFGEDWSDLYAKDTQAGGIPGPHRICGQHDFALANRVSYEFDFRGPSSTVKSACSSSLMALHSAVRSIRAGDCKSAVVAGTSLMFTPTATASMWPALSPDGNCRSFDAAANGYARGEAIIAILVKPLADAIKQGDAVRAVIRGTAVNFDGRTSNLTIPNPLAQEALMRKAYLEAGLEPRDTCFIEAHGTGTPVGDPIEAKAIARVFSGDETVFVGSVKPNLGHAEGASGLSSILKCIAAFEHGAIPPNILFDKANPNIDFKAANIAVPVETLPWPKNLPVRASVNCFGIGGANAHVILESMESFESSSPRAESNHNDVVQGETLARLQLLVISAQSEHSLARSIVEHQKYAESHRVDLRHIAHTLCRRREHLQVRSFCVTDGSSLRFAPPQRRSRERQVSMVFAGQGSQWPGMAATLLTDFPDFANDINELSGVLSRLETPPKWTISQKLSEIDIAVSFNEPCYAQPIITAVQIALVKLLRRWGIQASAVVGHSSGEVAAAYTAGAITAEAAMLISYYRGLATSQSARRGSMVAVGLSKTQVQPLLERDVVIACENSPQNVTLSGNAEAMTISRKRIQESYPDASMNTLDVEVAYHSPHMQDAAESYEQMLKGLFCCKAPSVPMFSSVTGVAIQGGAQLDSAYWRLNMESPVLFDTAMKTLVADSNGHNIFVEVGPQAILAGPIRQILSSLGRSQDTYISALQRNRDSTAAVLELAGSLHCCGVPIDFQFLVPKGNLVTDLPLYQWTHEARHWSESRVARQWRFSQFSHHELLGSRIMESNGLQPEWRNMLYTRDVSWLQDHRVHGHVVYPMAGYIAMAAEALRQIKETTDYLIHCITVFRPLLLSDSQTTELVTSFRPVRLTIVSKSSRWEFSIMAREDETWSEMCCGEIEAARPTFAIAQDTLPYSRSVSHHYLAFQKLGLQYGPACRLLDDVTVATTGMAAGATIVTPPVSESTYAAHPTVIDSCLQLNGIAMCQGLFRKARGLYLPVALEGLYISTDMLSGAPVAAQAIGMTQSSGEYVGQMWVVRGEKTLLHCKKAVFQQLPAETSAGDGDAVAGAKLLWKPDLDFLNLSCTTPAEFIKLLGHSKPTLRILYIQSDKSSDMMPGEILSKLITRASLPQYSTFKYAYASQEAMEATQLQLEQYKGISYERLEQNGAPSANEQDNEAFDLVVVAWDHLRIHASVLRRLLHPHGWLLVSDCRRETHLLDEIIGKVGLSPVQALVGEHDLLPKGGLHKSILVARPAYSFSPPKRLTILIPTGDQSAFASAVQRNLERQMVCVDVRTLHQDISKSQDIISLLDVEAPFFDNVTSCDFIAFQTLMRQISSNALLWVMRSGQKTSPDPRYSLSLGLIRTIRQELSISIATLELDSLADGSLSAMNQVLGKLCRRKMNDVLDPDYEFVLENGIVRIGRYHPVSAQEEVEAFAEHLDEARLEPGQAGTFENLRWTHCGKEAPGSTQVVVRMKAVGINFKDILVSLGVLASQPLGLEGAGIIESVGSDVTDLRPGDQVFVLETGCLATCTRLPARSCIRMPPNMTFEEAATMPCVYATAIHCLIDVGRLQKGESVLIHSACGGVGLAAIQVCQSIVGAEIYATVGSDEKAQYLIDTYGIPRDRIFDSRTSSFHEQIMKVTKGHGVDLVLNSLSGELLHMSWKCVAEFGRMVEIGKRDVIGRARLDMAGFGDNRSFFGVDLASFPPSKLRSLVERLLDFIHQGLIDPINPIKVFPANRIEETFRYMQSGFRMGKVVVSMPETMSELSATRVALKPSFNAEATYILVGGLGALGRATSTWMVEHGARYFIYISRSAGQSERDMAFLAELTSQGCSAQALAGSVADIVVVQKAACMALKPIKGVFQLSMALSNMAFLDMSHSEWEDGLVAKVDGTWNLHRALPLDMDFFILASSIGGCFGHIGQANYASANTFLDAFVHYRHSHGLRASVIDFGLIGDMGYIMEHPAVFERFRAAGSYFVGEDECITAIHWAMLNSSPRLPSEFSHGRLSMGIRTLKPLSSPDNHLPWVRDRRMAMYRNMTLGELSHKTMQSNDRLKQLMTQINADVTVLETPAALDLITQEIGTRIYAALMKPVEELSYDQKLEDIGVDSLVLMEMRNWSKRNLGGAEISTLDFVNAGTIRALGIVAVDALRKKHLPRAADKGDTFADTPREEHSSPGDENQWRTTKARTLDDPAPSIEDMNGNHVLDSSPTTEAKTIPTWLPPVFIPET